MFSNFSNLYLLVMVFKTLSLSNVPRCAQKPACIGSLRLFLSVQSASLRVDTEAKSLASTETTDDAVFVKVCIVYPLFGELQ